jgi:hypothetical protein
MHVVDMWARARSFAQQAESTTEREWRCVLENMRDLWIKLAHEAAASSAGDLARKSERLLALEDHLRGIFLRRRRSGEIVRTGARVPPGSRQSGAGNYMAAKDF